MSRGGGSSGRLSQEEDVCQVEGEDEAEGEG